MIVVCRVFQESINALSEYFLLIYAGRNSTEFHLLYNVHFFGVVIANNDRSHILYEKGRKFEEKNANEVYSQQKLS